MSLDWLESYLKGIFAFFLQFSNLILVVGGIKSENFYFPFFKS